MLKQDAYGVFHVFNQRLESGSVDQEWLDVKQTFMALEEWYEDRELFHVVGFLIQQNVSINDLLVSATTRTKSELAHELRCRAYRLVVEEDLDAIDYKELESSIRDHCEGLSYGIDSARIRLSLIHI